MLDRAGRERLVAIARRHDLIVIEDQVYGYLVHPQPAPLAAWRRSARSMSGLSKSVAAGLRVGFIAAPDAWLPAMERVIRSSTWNTPAVMSAIACMWMEDGTVAALEQAKREDARVRQALARRVLADLPVVAHPSSYFLWIPLAEEARADQIAMSLQRQQVAVTTAEPFATTSQVPHAIRLALGSVDMAVLEDSLEKIRRAVPAY